MRFQIVDHFNDSINFLVLKTLPLNEALKAKNYKDKLKKILKIMSPGIIILLLIGIFCTFKKRSSNEKTIIRPKVTEIEMRSNDLYRRDETLKSFDRKSNLPEWLKERKEVIFSKNSIVKGKQLGEGQFGTVFEGKLFQGNAV